MPVSAEEPWCSKKAEYWIGPSKVGERRWWKNGQLSDEHPMTNGVLHGVARWWREDGRTLVSEHSYGAGVLDGESRGWHENGKLATETHYRRGKKEGLESEWNEEGALLWRLPYRGGRLHGVARYWKGRGKLQIPFMKISPPLTFWIDGVEVSRVEYIQASKTNASLPALNEP